MEKNRIFIIPWNDDPASSYAAVQALYPQDEVVPVEKRALREGTFLEQVRILRRLRGKAVIFCFRSLKDLNAPLLIPWIGMLHRCRLTVLLDDSGNRKIYSRWSWLLLAPVSALALISDAWVLLHSFVILTIGLCRRFRQRRRDVIHDGPLVYLFPHPMLRSRVGGAMSHVRGFLSGLKECGVPCRVFSARTLPQDFFPEEDIPLSRWTSLFWEAKAIAYNWRFVRAVRRSLQGRHPLALYHRHSRFAFSGALLSRKLKIPLILEYNGSELWVSKNWDPARFTTWLRMCEDYTLASAALIVVVAEPLRKELLSRNIPDERIVVNPNGVDPDIFRPGAGGRKARSDWGISPNHLVICFLGTFSYWHGISVLQQAARRLLELTAANSQLPKLHFLMIGDGPLRAGVAEHLQDWMATAQVTFTGVVSHDVVPGLLDAADIFVSPHTALPDGKEFFGSPTKIFEYMAMGKAVIASRLGQMEQIFTHLETGWLVTPGSVTELVDAVMLLAARPDLRASLGSCARQAVIARYTWKHNAQVVWSALSHSDRINRDVGFLEPAAGKKSYEAARSRR